MTLASAYAAATFAGRCYKLKRIKETDCVTETAAVTAIASLRSVVYVMYFVQRGLLHMTFIRDRACQDQTL